MHLLCLHVKLTKPECLCYCRRRPKLLRPVEDPSVYRSSPSTALIRTCGSWIRVACTMLRSTRRPSLHLPSRYCCRHALTAFTLGKYFSLILLSLAVLQRWEWSKAERQLLFVTVPSLTRHGASLTHSVITKRQPPEPGFALAFLPLVRLK